MIQKWNKSKKISIMLYGFIFLLMFACNLLTPYMADDFGYRLSFVTREPLTSVMDIFPSMVVHTKGMNGRLSAHFLVQLFMLYPRIVFDLVNAGMFCLMIWLISGYASNERNNLLTMVVFCAVWLYEPAFAQVNLWQDGAANYLWSAVFVLLYLKPFVRMYLQRTALIQGGFSKVLFLLFSFFVGSYSETGSAAAICMAFLLCVLSAWRDIHRVDRYAAISVVVTVLGYISIYLSPAQWVNKSAKMSLFVLLRNLDIATQMYQSFGILVAATAVLLVINVCIATPVKTKMLAGVFIIGSLAANYIMIVAAYYPERSAVCTFTFLVTASAVLLQPVLQSDQWKTVAVSALVVLILTTIPAVISGTRAVSTTYLALRENERTIYESRDNGIMHVEIPMVRSGSKYSPVYDMKYLDAEDRYSWPNVYMSKYYGVESILGVKK